MSDEFSSRIEYQIVIPKYPVTLRHKLAMPVRDKVDSQLFGGRAVRESIERFQPDVIYADNPIYATQFKLLTLFSKRRIPSLILHLRGDWWRETTAWYSTAPWRKRVLGLQTYSYNWIAVALAEKITPICKWLEREVKRHFPGKSMEVVYQGVAPDQLFPEDGFTFERPAVAIIQNHSIYPKVTGLLSFRDIVQKLPRIHFYIAEGEPEARGFIQLVKQHYAGLPNVHFVSNVTNIGAVRKMLTASDCYVLASGLDCCPTTVLEASLLEKPVLGSRVGGVPEIISDGYTGWSIKNENTDEWVNRIRALLEDSKLSRRLGGQGRKWVSEKFGWGTIAPQVEQMIINEAERRR